MTLIKLPYSFPFADVSRCYPQTSFVDFARSYRMPFLGLLRLFLRPVYYILALRGMVAYIFPRRLRLGFLYLPWMKNYPTIPRIPYSGLYFDIVKIWPRGRPTGAPLVLVF